MRTRRRPRLKRWLKTSLRCLVALLLVLVLPSRPAMAGCFEGLGAKAAASSSALDDEHADESDGCCPSKRGQADEKESSPRDSQKEPRESGCPCHGECPPGCSVACGFAAVEPPMQIELGPVMRLQVLDAERVAEPPGGIGPEILHVPR